MTKPVVDENNAAVMEQVLDEDGEPVMEDVDGTPTAKMQQKTEPVMVTV